MSIHFFQEGVAFPFNNETHIYSWLNSIIQDHDYTLEELNYIFCDDEYLLSLNQKYLDHDTLTDIITFDNSETDTIIEGDIYISVERVKENAKQFDKTFENELHRVMAHGLLHLLGFKDKSEHQIKAMREKEEACLSLLANLL